jgi:aspartate/methionine/tyrosine aminotransferase
MFSARLPPSLAPNRISEALDAARARGEPLTDLTQSNPTAVGLDYPDDQILAALADPRALAYTPSPRGALETRCAVAAYYGNKGHTVDPDRLTLTASTSEAYAFLFKLLCNPMERVLVPQPSYPLFDLLASLEGVRPIGYPLGYHGGWFLDVDELAHACDRDTRAVLLVNPNNPTGSFLKRDERDRLVALCRDRDLAIISDEVFADYAFSPDVERVDSLVGTGEVLTFCLSGLSKVAGLPQLKLAWIHVGGPAARVAEAEARLELIADTFLSVAAPTELAAPSLLELAPRIAEQIGARTRRNRTRLRAATARSACQVLDAEGGWYAVVRVPDTHTEEEWTIALLEQDRLIVQPGFFYDFAAPAYLVLSLLIDEPTFAAAAERLVARVAAWA